MPRLSCQASDPRDAEIRALRTAVAASEEANRSVRAAAMILEETIRRERVDAATTIEETARRERAIAAVHLEESTRRERDAADRAVRRQALIAGKIAAGQAGIAGVT